MPAPPPPGPNFKNRTLYHGDCDNVMRGFNNEVFNLIAIDPPFNTGLDFHAKKGGKVKGSYQDRWKWDKRHDAWLESLRQDSWLALAEVIEAARDAGGKPMGAFICWLSVRLVRMHRILHSNGSLFLHLDHHAVHYAKPALDAIFGTKGFRNEIIWFYPDTPGRPKRDFPRKHDTILRYVKGDGYTFNADDVRVPIQEDSKQRYKTPRRLGGREYTGGESAVKGKIPEDVWRIPAVKGNSKENTDYPTQKPLALYRNIIKVASNPGDWVLDCFCGCATTCVAAEVPDPDKPGQDRRNWIGIDIWDEAADVVRDRVQRECNHLDGGEVTVTDKVPERTDSGETVPIRDAPDTTKHPQADDGMNDSQRKAYLIRQAGGAICAGCLRDSLGEDYLELDHNTPKSQMGLDHISNRLLLCRVCNNIKSNKLTLGLLQDKIHQLAKSPGNKRYGWAKASPLVTGVRK